MPPKDEFEGLKELVEQAARERQQQRPPLDYHWDNSPAPNPRPKGRQFNWARPIGFCARLVVYAIVFIAWWSYFPSHATSTPLAQLTIGDIGAFVFFVVIGLALGRALFNPSKDPSVREAWEGLGVLMIAGAGLAVLYAYR